MNILIMNRKYDGVFGGVEHMITLIINHLVQSGHTCHLLSLDTPDATIMYDIDPSVKWHKVANQDAQKKASWSERYLRFKKIRTVLQAENIDIAIGFQDGAFLSLAISALGIEIPVIAAERNAPSRFKFLKEGRFSALRFQSFRLAKYITVQCPSYVTDYPKYLRHKIKVIPNPVFKKDVPIKKQKKQSDTKIILSVGRFSYQKNYGVLIAAFSQLSTEFPDWNLVLVGDGEDRETLENLALELKVEERVIFAGYQKDPSSFFTNSDIFCLPSRWEGFPNALAEAMSHSVPSVGFRDCAGVSDLIDHEQTGYLAEGNENKDSLENALRVLMANNGIRKKIGENAYKKLDAYEPIKTLNMWNTLFQTIEK
jgi:glycosyltransferase involved in cell wall biosynthesis